MVSRSYERPTVGLWPMRIREALPVIPVPLKQDDPDAVLDLQQLLHETFDAAGYADYIYQGRPRPPRHPDEEAWSKQCLGPFWNLVSSFAPRKPRIFRRAKGDKETVISRTILTTG